MNEQDANGIEQMNEQDANSTERGASNALRVSRRLEGITFIDQDGFFLHLDAKIALIQPVGCTRLLGRRLLAHGARSGDVALTRCHFFEAGGRLR